METVETVKDMQKKYANIFGCHGIWDRYSGTDDEVLSYKLKRLFPLLPVPEEEESTEQEINKIRKDNEKLTHQRNNLLKQLWAQRIYSEGNLKMSVIYVLWTPPIENDQPIRMAKDATTYVSHVVFRIWKCSIQGESEDCCKIFIDETGRVYENWKNFINSNIYPEGILVTPKNGFYSMTENDEVRLECHLTPNSTLLKKTVRVVDKSVTVGGVASAIAIFIPFAPIVIGGMIVGASTTVYTMGRSIDNLVDKGQHGQSISITNRQARLDWFNILSSAFSLGATGATVGAACHVARGKTLPQIAETAIDGIHATALACNGINLTNGVCETIIKIKEDEGFSSLEILQLSQSLVLFTHSIHNYRLALQIIKASKTNGASTQTILRNEQKQFVNNVEGTKNVPGIKSTDIAKGVDKFRCLSTIPDFASLLFGVGLPVLTKIEDNYVLERTKQIVDKFFVASKVALDNCLKIISKIMNIFNEGIDYMIMMAEKFLDEIKNAVETRIRPLIPFEHVLWDIFEISTKLKELTITKITEDFLKKNYTKILTALKKLYSEYFKQNPSRRIKCKVCSGYYEKCELVG